MINFTVGAYHYSISTTEIINNSTPNDLILDLDCTGIILSNFKKGMISEDITVVLWINPAKETITCQTFGMDIHGEEYVDSTEDFRIKPEDCKSLFEFEHALSSSDMK